MPSKISVDQIAHSNETNALEIDTSGNVTIQQDLKFAGNAAIKDSAGNNVISESAGVITVNADAAVIEGSSAGDLVRITQTGTGNALVVEDETNPDSTPFVVNANGDVGIGTGSPSYPLHVSDTLGFPILIERTNSGDAGIRFKDSNTTNADSVRIGAIGDAFRVFSNGTERMRIDSSGNVGIGTGSPGRLLDVRGSSNPEIRFTSTDSSDPFIYLGDQTDFVKVGIGLSNSDNAFVFRGYNNVERMRIDSSGNVSVGKSSPNFALDGVDLYSWGRGDFTVDQATPLRVNRLTNDGYLIDLVQNSTSEGRIAVSGQVVSYVGFTGTHWSRLLDGSTPDIPRGTILESLDEMMDWVKEDGTLEDDIKHIKCKISDTVDSKNVYGLFFAWDNEDDYNDLQVAQVGSFVIRIHSSQDVQRGDLIQSNGDGTGKIQADDIIRSSTVAKVISNHRVETYEDGSYIVPCVIHC